MARYLVNKNAQANGDHEVHVTSCDHLPNTDNRLPLGEFDSCGPAVAKAKRTYPQSNGCAYCCPRCNTG